jgi:hypothetical protein
MASEKSYVITLSNNKTEKQAIDFLLSNNKNFLLPSKEGRKEVVKKLGLDSMYSRTFDLILIDGHTNQEDVIEITDTDQIVLVEIKSTMKFLPNLPYGFFFGATENEFNLAVKLQNNFKFCFVSLHENSMGYKLLDLNELNAVIKNKRTQFQINLKTKPE